MGRRKAEIVKASSRFSWICGDYLFLSRLHGKKKKKKEIIITRFDLKLFPKLRKVPSCVIKVRIYKM